MDLMQHDWELRKTATHNTFLHLGIVLGGIGPYDILDDVLMNYDSQAEDGRFMHKSIKTNLRGFAKEQANHIRPHFPDQPGGPSWSMTGREPILTE
jgi:hypothetical protein